MEQRFPNGKSPGAGVSKGPVQGPQNLQLGTGFNRPSPVVLGPKFTFRERAIIFQRLFKMDFSGTIAKAAA